MTRLGFAHEAGNVPVLRGVGHIDQVMSDAAPLGQRGLCRTYVHPPINLHRVSSDDLDVTERLRHEHAKR